MTARRRVLSIWLPHLAIERWAKASDCAPETPVILTVEATHGPVIHAVTEAAGERGARPGARLTDARAIDPTLVAIPADPDGDTALLQRLARWASRWSPVVEMDGADALRLDVSGVAHLFGGEAGLIADVQARFARVGLRVRTAIAPTAGAAWALSHFAPSSIVTPAKAGAQFSSRRDAEAQSGRASASLSGFSASLREIKEQLDSRFRGNDENDLASLLASLPVAALRLPPQAVRTLERLGLKTIAQLAGIERRSLARRFREADNPVDALDRMLGRKPEPLTAVPDNPPPRATLRLEEPATHSEAAPQALQRLIPELVKQLESRRLGARRLALTGFRVDGSVAIASVATSIASREPRHLQRLLAGVIADGPAALDPGFGFDAFALEASWAEPLGAAQDSLVEEPDGEADVARLVDRLSVKLGAERVRRPCTVESHAPERASGWVTAVSSMRGASAAKQSSSAALDCFASLAMTTRPHRLLDQPEAIAVVYATPEGLPRRFVWRRAVHDIARVEGPERIAPEWWRERSTARLRDYYRVEDREGRRYWIYREGVFGDGRGGAPEWFLHGLFG